jgi:hypothetical protein
MKARKLASFDVDVEVDPRIATRALIDKLVADYGQERFLEATSKAGLRGDSDSWPLARLEEVADSLNLATIKN